MPDPSPTPPDDSARRRTPLPGWAWILLVVVAVGGSLAVAWWFERDTSVSEAPGQPETFCNTVGELQSTGDITISLGTGPDATAPLTDAAAGLRRVARAEPPAQIRDDLYASAAALDDVAAEAGSVLADDPTAVARVLASLDERLRELQPASDRVNAYTDRWCGATINSPATDGLTVTGMPLSTALPDSGSISVVVGEQVGVDARRGGRPRRAAAPSSVVAPAVREAHHPGPDGVGDLDRAPHRAHPRAHLGVGRRRRGRGGRRRRGGPAGCSAPCPSPARSTLCIHELLERRCAPARPARALGRRRASRLAARRARSATISSARQLDRPARGAQHLGQPRLQRAEVDAVRVRRQRRRASRPSGVGAEAVAVRAGAQHAGRACARVARGGRQRRRRAARRRRGRPAGEPGSPRWRRRAGASSMRSSSASGSPSAPRPGGDEGEAGEDLALRRAGRASNERRRVVGDVAHRQAVEGEVVVAALERRRAAAGSRRRGGWSR